jgi:hypothetical protein
MMGFFTLRHVSSGSSHSDSNPVAATRETAWLQVFLLVEAVTVAIR